MVEPDKQILTEMMDFAEEINKDIRNLKEFFMKKDDFPKLNLKQLKESLEDDPFSEPLKIIFWGRSSSGKTSLINSLIENVPIYPDSKERIFPIKSIANTRYFTFISLSNEDKYEIEVIDKNNSEKFNEMKKEDFINKMNELNGFFLRKK